MKRRSFLSIAAIAAIGLPSVSFAATRVDVSRGPECDCWVDWMLYLRNNGFNVVAHELPDVAAFRARQGITPAIASRHTALVDG